MENLSEPTIKNLYIENLNIQQLESLLPCYRKDVEKVIVERINDLRNLSTPDVSKNERNERNS